MKFVRYFFEYILIIILFCIFKLLGYRISSEFGCFLGKTFGPFFRSKKIIKDNLIKFDDSLTPEKIKKISKEMWGNYGRILSEYPYISNFRKGDLDKYIKIENISKLDDIKKGQPVVFISAHFSNFELMAMVIEKAGVNLSAIYRPLNNKMVNSIMEPLRKKHILSSTTNLISIRDPLVLSFLVVKSQSCEVLGESAATIILTAVLFPLPLFPTMMFKPSSKSNISSSRKQKKSRQLAERIFVIGIEW